MFLKENINSNANKIMTFIHEIKKFDVNNKVLKNAFTKNFCYDFAYMLQRVAPGSKIVWISNRKHYVLEDNGIFYEITGIVKITPADKLDYTKSEGNELSFPVTNFY